MVVDDGHRVHAAQVFPVAKRLRRVRGEGDTGEVDRHRGEILPAAIAAEARRVAEDVDVSLVHLLEPTGGGHLHDAEAHARVLGAKVGDHVVADVDDVPAIVVAQRLVVSQKTPSRAGIGRAVGRGHLEGKGRRVDAHPECQIRPLRRAPGGSGQQAKQDEKHSHLFTGILGIRISRSEISAKGNAKAASGPSNSSVSLAIYMVKLS